MSSSPPSAELLEPSAEAMIRQLDVGQRTIDSLQKQLERIAARRTDPQNWTYIAQDCVQLGGVIARLQLAQVAAALALARFRQAGPIQHHVYERRGGWDARPAASGRLTTTAGSAD